MWWSFRWWQIEQNKRKKHEKRYVFEFSHHFQYHSNIIQVIVSKTKKKNPPTAAKPPKPDVDWFRGSNWVLNLNWTCWTGSTRFSPGSGSGSGCRSRFRFRFSKKCRRTGLNQTLGTLSPVMLYIKTPTPTRLPSYWQCMGTRQTHNPPPPLLLSPNNVWISIPSSSGRQPDSNLPRNTASLTQSTATRPSNLSIQGINTIKRG